MNERHVSICEEQTHRLEHMTTHLVNPTQQRYSLTTLGACGVPLVHTNSTEHPGLVTCRNCTRTKALRKARRILETRECDLCRAGLATWLDLAGVAWHQTQQDQYLCRHLETTRRAPDGDY